MPSVDFAERQYRSRDESPWALFGVFGRQSVFVDTACFPIALEQPRFRTPEACLSCNETRDLGIAM
jgi:hypothetical protein